MNKKEINVYQMIDWYLSSHPAYECRIVQALKILYDNHVKEFTFEQLMKTAGLSIENDEERGTAIDFLKELSEMKVFINFCGLTPILREYGFIVNRNFYDMKIDDNGNGVFTGHIAPEVAEIVANMFLDGWDIKRVESYMSKHGMN